MAPSYDLLLDYGDNADPHHVSTDPHWLLAVVRSGILSTYDRETTHSVKEDVDRAVGPRAGAEDTLVLDADVVQLTVTRRKSEHTKHLQAQLAPGMEYWRHIRGGDWVFAWMMNNHADFLRVSDLVRRGRQANGPRDGLKFVGRVESCRRQRHADPTTGTKRVSYQLSATGFAELDTSIFYDLNVATNDVLQQNLGKWLTRIGIDLHDFLGAITSRHPDQDNVNTIVPRLLDIIVGKGVSSDINPADARGSGLQAALGGGAGEGAPNAYAVPRPVGRLLGRAGAGGAAVLSYADLLELLQGVQKYGQGQGLDAFVPELDDGKSSFTRRVTPQGMLGTFYISFLDLLNKPLWSVLQQYVNPAINEIYTCLRVSPDGVVMPTVVFRQIPFTTDAFADLAAAPTFTAPSTPIPHTLFSNLPRWKLPASLAHDDDLGFSEATRTNLVHVYGVASMGANNWAVGRQMVLDPPLVDDLDIVRTGPRPYMTQVDCAVDDQRDRSPGKWMRLIADWQMGMHLTLNGVVHAAGVQAPIAEGDNLEYGGMIFHVEGITDSASVDPGYGRRSWRTSLELSYGHEVDGGADDLPGFPLLDPARPDPSAGVNPGIDAYRNRGGDDPALGAGDFVPPPGLPSVG